MEELEKLINELLEQEYEKGYNAGYAEAKMEENEKNVKEQTK